MRLVLLRYFMFAVNGVVKMETKLKEIIRQYLSDEKLVEELTKTILEIAEPRVNLSLVSAIDVFAGNEERN